MLHSKFGKTALVAITLLLHPAYTCTTMYAPVENGIKQVSNALEEFFSTENNETYVAHCEKIKSILAQLNDIINKVAHADQSKYTKQICLLGKSVQKDLLKVIAVLEKNKNRGPAYFMLVAKDLRNACDVTKVFASVKERITLLKKVAQKENNPEMIKNLDGLLKALSLVDKTWQSMGTSDLTFGLKHRMGQK